MGCSNSLIYPYDIFQNIKKTKKIKTKWKYIYDYKTCCDKYIINGTLINTTEKKK
jgi:hypothetical protein